MYTPFTKEAGRPPEYSFSLIYGIEHITRFHHQDMKFGGHIFWIRTVTKHQDREQKRTLDTLNGLYPSGIFRDFPTTTTSHQQHSWSELRTAWGHVLQPQGTKSNQSCARASCPAVRHRSHISQTSYPHPKKQVHLPSRKISSEVGWQKVMCGKIISRVVLLCVCWNVNRTPSF